MNLSILKLLRSVSFVDEVFKIPAPDNRQAKPTTWNHDVVLKIVAGVFGMGVLFMAGTIGTLAAYR